MSGTLLHIVLAERALDRAAIPESTKREIRNSIWDFRLGAVLFDLPYYEHLILQAISRAVRTDYQFNAWGEVLHVHSPTGLCRRLLDSASSQPNCVAALAMALGALTHAAVDAVFHPEIERRVLLSEKGHLCPNRIHSEIETQMDICVHKRLLGHSGIGTPYTWEVLRIVPNRDWAGQLRSAIFEIHQTAPSLQRIKGWLRGLLLFARLHADSRFFWVSSSHYPDVDRDASSVELAEQAMERARRYMEAGFAYQNGSLPLQGFQEAVPDINLISGTNSTSSL
jgi:hypothetical protein